jgi:hypothetical protein
LELYASGNFTVMAAAKKCGASHESFFQRRRVDPEFAAQYAAAQSASVDVLEERMLARAYDNRANKGNLTAMFGILRARRPSAWGGNVRVEHSGSLQLAGDFAQAMKEMPSGITAAQTQH